MEGTSLPWRVPEVFSENRHPHSLQEVAGWAGQGELLLQRGQAW